MKAQFSDAGPKSISSGQTASLGIGVSSFKEAVTWSQKTGGGLSTLSLTCCVILGKPLSLNLPIYKMVMTSSSQVWSLNTIQLHYYYMLRNGGKISREKQRPRGSVVTCIPRAVCPPACKERASVTCCRKEILPWSIVLPNW